MALVTASVAGSQALVTGRFTQVFCGNAPPATFVMIDERYNARTLALASRNVTSSHAEFFPARRVAEGP